MRWSKDYVKKTAEENRDRRRIFQVAYRKRNHIAEKKFLRREVTKTHYTAGQLQHLSVEKFVLAVNQPEFVLSSSSGRSFK